MGLSVMKKPFIYAISGYKNSGKTTTITRLIPLLVKKGLRVAVIKHDGHDFVGDEPGTDSYKHQKAGAYGTAVFSEGHYMVNKRGSSVTERDLIAMFPEADIILIEGLKDSLYPKYFCDYPSKVPDDEELGQIVEEIINALKEPENRAEEEKWDEKSKKARIVPGSRLAKHRRNEKENMTK